MSLKATESPARKSGLAGHRSRWFFLSEMLIERTIALCSFLTIAGVFLILFTICKEALPVLFRPEDPAHAGLAQFLGTKSWQPVSDIPKYSFIPLIVGTLKVTMVAIVVAVPIGVLAALFTAEFAPRWVGEWIKPCVELLAGIPSVVMGFFALIVLASFLQSITGSVTRLNALKQAVAFATNMTAAALFLFSGQVVWSAAAVMAVGALIGGALGGRLAGRIKPVTLRWVVVTIGIIISIIYFIRG